MNKIPSNHKGLLLTVVLCGCIWSCSPQQPTAPILLGPPLPDPAIFFQNQIATAVPADSLSLDEIAQLQVGDVLLRRGYGLISDYIVAALEEPCALTHAGLIVQQGHQLGVLHTASSSEHDGTLVESLTAYVQQSQAHSLVAFRPQCTPAQRQKLLALAQVYEQQALPFDYQFDDQNSEALYCLELLRDLFLEAFKQDYLPFHHYRGELSLLGFQSFFDKRKFILLFNHCSTNPSVE
ncbi:MAG: YiiX/YebB-like N1pC/P60 family cysteine hydrolase [Aureispira sp.]